MSTFQKKKKRTVGLHKHAAPGEEGQELIYKIVTHNVDIGLSSWEVFYMEETRAYRTKEAAMATYFKGASPVNPAWGK